MKVQSHDKHSKDKQLRKHKMQSAGRDGATYYSSIHSDKAKHDVCDNEIDEESQDYSSASDEELEVTPPPSASLPSHRPPHGSQSPDRSHPIPVQSSPRPVNNQPMQSLNSLPVYTLNSNDQSYILTKTRPDGSMEYYTATPVSPNYSVDGLSASPPQLPHMGPLHVPLPLSSLQPVPVLPGATSTPIKSTDRLTSISQPTKLTGLPRSLPLEIHAQPDASLSAMQQPPPHIQHYPGLYDMSRSDTHSSSPVMAQSKHSKSSFSDGETTHMNKPGEVDSLHKELQGMKSERAKLETENASLRKLHDSIHVKAGTSLTIYIFVNDNAILQVKRLKSTTKR